MNPADPLTPAPAPKPRRSLWKWLGFSALGLFILTVAGVASLFFLDGDAAVLRDEMRGSRNPLSLKTRIQLNLGPVSLGMARLVVSRIDGVDEDARLALSSVRSASVGVYDLPDKAGKAGPDLAHMDTLMQDRGWHRWVIVRKEGDLVVVYGPDAPGWGGTLPLCVGVKQASKLIVVYLRGDPQPLLEIARRNGGGDLLGCSDSVARRANRTH